MVSLPLSCYAVLIDFSLIVKAATSIFISRRGSAISSAKEGKSGLIYNLAKVNELFGPHKRACILCHPDRTCIYTDLTCINP